MYPFYRFFGIALVTVSLTACSFLSGMQQRFTVCDYDRAWESALDVVKDRSVSTQDKDAGLIVTDWLEIPMPGRTYGLFQRDMADSKDRSRITLRVKRLDDITQTQIGFIEDRQRWAFRGGSRLFGWAQIDPSEDVLRDLHNRLGTKLKERGCSLASL